MKPAKVEKLGLPSFVRVFPVLMVTVDQDSLDDSSRPILEILVVVEILVSAAGVVASVRHLQKLVYQAPPNSFAPVSGVDEELHRKGIAEQARWAAVLVQVNVPDHLLAHVP